MSRWRAGLPAPGVSLALFVGWLLVNDWRDPVHLLLALLLAWAVPLWALRLRPRPGPVRRWGVLLRLIGRVGLHVPRSAFEVALGVLRLPRQVPRSRFVRIPLEIRDPHALAALAIITTLVPGTVWSELANDHSAMLLHVYDVVDEPAFIAQYKADYEAPLKEIFE